MSWFQPAPVNTYGGTSSTGSTIDSGNAYDDSHESNENSWLSSFSDMSSASETDDVRMMPVPLGALSGRNNLLDYDVEAARIPGEYEPLPDRTLPIYTRPRNLDYGTIGAVLAALGALGAGTYAWYTAVKDEPENETVLKGASAHIQSLWERKPEARAIIKQVAHQQRAAQSQGVNDLGAGGSTTGSTNLGEPYWSATPRRINNMIVSTTEVKRRPANHNFSGGKVRRSVQAFSGHHTMEFVM